MAWVRHTLILALAAGVASCSDVVAPGIEQIQVTVHVSQPEMVPGDTVEFRVIGSNPTNRRVTLRTNSCVLAVQLLTRSGSVVFQEPYVCNDVELVHDLLPGQSVERTFSFDGTTTWGPFLDQLGREPALVLEPGLYRVVGGISVGFTNASDPVDLRIK